MKFIPLIFISLLFLAVFDCAAKVSLPSIFGDHMVLQQQAKVTLWGKGKPNAAIKVVGSWNGISYKTQANALGNWRLKINTPNAGGPFNLHISDGEVLILKDILIGEVWVCAGQSNMEMPLKGNSSPILHAAQIILTADNPQLRLFKVGRATALSPLNDPKGNWRLSNSESARDYSALAFQYGQLIQQKLKVPVGLVLSTVGGTMIESWMDSESLKPFETVKVPLSLDTVKAPHKLPSTLYNGMIAPIAGFGIKGFIWMQGESNRHEPALYGNLFPAMVKQWRQAWGLGEIPFYYVQLAPFASSDPLRSGAKLREAQLKAMQIIPNSGMVCAMDVGMENDIHFMDKTTLAQRLAYWALGATYAIKGIEYRSPTYSSMEISGAKVTLNFENGSYLTSYRKAIKQFEIAGADQKFYAAQAVLVRNQITVSSPEVKSPIAVRYAFKEWAVAEVYNNDGFPLSSFRTDDWK